MRCTRVFALVASGLALGLVGCGSPSHNGSADRGTESLQSSTLTPTTASMPTTEATTPAPSALAPGQTATTAAGNLTVHVISYPVAGSEQAQRIASHGVTFAVADIEVCPSTAAGFSPNDFHLFDSDNHDYTFWNVQIGAKTPNLTKNLYPPIIGVCSRGYLTFEVPPGKRLIALGYVGGSGGSPVIWRLPS